jgi:hypothetical protein
VFPDSKDDHRVALKGRRHRWLTMGRDLRGDEIEGREIECRLRGVRDVEVAAMNRVEGAAENADAASGHAAD